MANGFGDVVLMGLGTSTLAAGEYLSGLGPDAVASLTCYAGAESNAARERAALLEARGVRVVWGEDVAGTYDLGIVSPGIPCTGAFYRAGAAACAELVSEPELAWRESPRDWVAITGTNGKTTTTSLTAALLHAGGIPARTVGNIGLPPISCVADRAPGEVFVAELSSFQLESSPRLAPRAAALLNVTPDHVAWHGSLAAYAAAKERVFANMGTGDLCLVGTDGPCRAVAERLRLRGMRTAVVGEEPRACAPDGAWIDAAGRLAVRLGGRDHVLARYADMKLAGPHNAQNALAAAALALEMGADDEAVAEALLAFAPLEHRVEPCGAVGGVSYCDDSKATNTDAAAQALASFGRGRVIVLLGGFDKGTDLSDLAREVVGRCRAAVAYGAAGPRFAAALQAAGALPVGEGEAPAGSCALVCAPHMREAFDAARALARPGDTVLLSPACSSFDEFGGYAERGRAFKAWVAELAAAERGRDGDEGGTGVGPSAGPAAGGPR